MSVLALIAAYLTGTIPFGLLVAKFVRGIDIRTAGSGNIGATNVGRVLGAKWGVAVLLLDALKGMLPTAFYPLLVAGGDDAQRLHLAVGCGLAGIVGHMFPCWLNFRGGKGVATALGVVIVLAPISTLIALAVFAASFALFRIVSLSSMLAALAFLVATLWNLRPHPFSEQTWSLATFAIAVPLLIIVRHCSNLARLFRGEEQRYQTAVVKESTDAPKHAAPLPVHRSDKQSQSDNLGQSDKPEAHNESAAPQKVDDD